MKEVPIHYGVIFGKGDSTDWIDYEITLTDDESAVYDKAVADGVDPNDVPELQSAIWRAYKEIEEMEIENGLAYGNEYVMECQGVAPMDPDELNDFVADRDSHALEFFGLIDATDEELEDWDAYDLDELPTIADFQEDFEPYSPYDEGWTLNVKFVDPNEDF